MVPRYFSTEKMILDENRSMRFISCHVPPVLKNERKQISLSIIDSRSSGSAVVVVGWVVLPTQVKNY